MSVTTLPRQRAAVPVPVVRPAARELELKFLVSEPGFKASQQWPMLAPTGARRAARLRSRYFDTENGDLHRANMSLRMRAQRRGYMMTLKYDGTFPGGLFERGEAEIFTASETPDPNLFGPEFTALLAAVTKGRELAAAYETDIRRLTHKVVSETSEIEIAFDAGWIIASAQREPVREIEMELKSGAPEDLYRLGVSLAEHFPVRLGTEAKSARGFRLATGTAPAIMRAGAPLSGAPSVDQAIGVLINDCLAQFTGNWPAFFAGDAQNAIHQMRVSMRRLRAMLGLFQRGFPCAEWQGFRDQAKRVASGMGEARNLDVFLALLRDGPMRALPDETGLADIVAECEARRAAAYEAVDQLLAAPETTRFILSLQAFVARHGWRNALPPEALARLTAPAADFAALHIGRLHARVLKRGGKRLALPPHERHELRIDLKKLRYAADGFAGLFDGAKRMRAYMRAAARLQDALGGYNDLIVANGMVARLAAADSRAAGVIVGWCGRGAMVGDADLREAWKSFRKLNLPVTGAA